MGQGCELGQVMVCVRNGKKQRGLHIIKMDTVQAIEDKRRYFADKQREWRTLNPDRAREIQRRYYEAHRQERIESALRRYRAKALEVLEGSARHNLV